MTKTTVLRPPSTPDRPRPRPGRGQGRLVERQRQRRRRRRMAIGAVAAVVVIVAGLIVAKVTSGGSGTTGATGPAVTAPASPAVIDTLAAVPVATMVTAAAGTGGPTAVSGAALTSGGKPEVLYIGAEWCPYCAATRWPMVMALLKFGTFRGLGTTHSASDDTDPNTATFSFHGATYTSAYLSFVGVETATNQRQPLDTPTAAEQQLWVTATPAGSIPFIDFGGQAEIVGASYDPAVLSGLTVTAIAQRIAAGTGPVARNIEAVAGLFTAQLCRMTGDQPATVCSAFTS